MYVYKGYTGVVQEGAGDPGRYFGTVQGLAGTVITFVGDTPDEAAASMRESVDCYLEWCEEGGEPPELPGAESSIFLDES